VLSNMLLRGLNSPLTSSVGRLFDAVSAILGLQQSASFEGEAAMALEFAADRAMNSSAVTPAHVITEAGKLIIDWRPLILSLLSARRSGTSVEDLAAAFHEALVEAIVEVARRMRIERVLLTGGCFQNMRLTARAILRLRAAGFTPHWHHRVPPNDGGLAVGQAAFAARPLSKEND